MEPVISELEKMGDPDFKLKATSKDLHNRWLPIDTWAKQRRVVLQSIRHDWDNFAAALKSLIEWIDERGEKLKGLKEQVNLSDEKEVEGQLKVLKVKCFIVIT